MKELKQLQQAFIRQHEEYLWDGGKGKVWTENKWIKNKSGFYIRRTTKGYIYVECRSLSEACFSIIRYMAVVDVWR